MVTSKHTTEPNPSTTELTRKPNIAIRAIRLGRTAIFNGMTLRSEREALALAAAQVQSPPTATEKSVDERINDYLDAPMNPDGTHPDPLSSTYNLFGP